MAEAAYVAARRVLLDALEAMQEQLDAIVLVGAQAVYLHTGDADFAIAPFTTDGDVAIDPALLGDQPLLGGALARAGFQRAPGSVGSWMRTVIAQGQEWTVPIDLLVPESLGGPGRRAARLPPHEEGVARKVVGLEAALVDKGRHPISALDSADSRTFQLWVAGPAALLVAKLHKIADRAGEPARVEDKDALDVYRLLQATSTEAMAENLRILLTTDSTRAITRTAIDTILPLFGATGAPGCLMAVRSVGLLIDAEVLTDSLVVLAQELVEEI